MNYITFAPENKRGEYIRRITQAVLDFETEHGQGIPAQDAGDMSLPTLGVFAVSGGKGDPSLDKTFLSPISTDVGQLPESPDEQLLGGVTFQIHNDWLFLGSGFVWEPYRGKGVYSALMHELEALARRLELSGIDIWTYEWEAPALYEALGFTRNGIHHNFPKGNTAIEYIKEFEVG